MKVLTEEQLDVLDRNHASYPVPLSTKCNLLMPFVYYRPYGFMYVPSGYHAFVMATLCAFDHGVKDHYELLKLPKFYHSDGPQDISHVFFDTPGLAYKSSLSTDRVRCAREDNLTSTGKRIFGYVEYF